MPASNAEIAELFDNMATLLEIQGDAIFKIRAYQLAARTIERLSFTLEDAVQDEMDLKAIPGIGDAINKKIREMISTGRVEAYEQLKSELPEGVLALVKVPGVGPKTAKFLAKELGATSIDDLERSILNGRLAELPGLGEKTAENILRHIRYVRSKDGSAADSESP